MDIRVLVGWVILILVILFFVWIIAQEIEEPQAVGMYTHEVS